MPPGLLFCYAFYACIIIHNLLFVNSACFAMRACRFTMWNGFCCRRSFGLNGGLSDLAAGLSDLPQNYRALKSQPSVFIFQRFPAPEGRLFLHFSLLYHVWQRNLSTFSLLISTFSQIDRLTFLYHYGWTAPITLWKVNLHMTLFNGLRPRKVDYFRF